MMVMRGVGRRMARWVACAAAVACCVAGVALPAHADDGPVPVPSTPPTAAPSTPMFPGRTIHMNARFEFGEDIVPGRQGITPTAYLKLEFSQWGNGWSLSEQECQELVSTFWSGTGPDYQVEAAVKYDDCQIEAYYLGEARHAFYSLDESGHMQVRPPMAYLNQIATSFDNVYFKRLDFDVKGLNNAYCNANPSKDRLNVLLNITHMSSCVWDVDDGATMPTTDEPLMEGDVEDYFTTYLAGTVGPFTELNPPINPFTITPTTDPAAGASAAASGNQSQRGESSSTGLLIGIGTAITLLLLVGTGALVVALRRTH